MDDTPHHLSHKTSATPPPLSRMADLNTSHYYVVQISEYDAMKTEIERLRGLLDRAYRLAVGHGFDPEVFSGWEEAIEAYEEARCG